MNNNKRQCYNIAIIIRYVKVRCFNETLTSIYYYIIGQVQRVRKLQY